MSECCKIACFQNAKTLGKEIKLEGLNCYFSGSEQSKGALLMISDIYGWTLNNARAAADKIAKDANIAVYLPEFFVDGDHAPFPPEERAQWDIAAFMKRNPPTDFRKIESASKGILARHEKLGAMGYCWGAQGALHLGRAEGGPASAVGFAHPVVNDMGPFERLAKPAIFLCCAVDQFFPVERRQAAEQVMLNKAEDGIISKFVLYPGTTHGNLMRGDEKNELTANAMADSLDETANFMRKWISR